MLKEIGKATIIIYKKTLSHVIGKNCSFVPTCSMYTYDAIDKYGFVLGVVLGLKRLLRCHPMARGGHDPVKENFKGKAKWTL